MDERTATRAEIPQQASRRSIALLAHNSTVRFGDHVADPNEKYLVDF